MCESMIRRPSQLYVCVCVCVLQSAVHCQGVTKDTDKHTHTRTASLLAGAQQRSSPRITDMLPHHRSQSPGAQHRCCSSESDLQFSPVYQQPPGRLLTGLQASSPEVHDLHTLMQSHIFLHMLD